MKKFLIMLMIVAMASFLFVGCLPGVAPDVDEEVDEEVPVAKTDTPFITKIDDGNVVLYSTETQYAKGLTTEGISVAGAVIKLYVNGVQAGIANSGAVGKFIVTRSMIKLTEGVKKLYVTATVPGLAESDPSTEYTFTVDLTAPYIASAVADATHDFITVTFNEAVNTKAAATVPVAAPLFANSALNSGNWTVIVNEEIAELTDTDFVATSSKIIRITLDDVGDTGYVFGLICTGIGDSLGNPIKTTAPSTYAGIVTGEVTDEDEVPAAPKIASVTAANTGTTVEVLDAGDTLTIVFNVATNKTTQDIYINKAAVDAVLTFAVPPSDASSFGADYSGVWTDNKTLVITLVDDTGVVFTINGEVTIIAGANIKTLDGLSAASTDAMGVSGGTF